METFLNKNKWTFSSQKLDIYHICIFNIQIPGENTPTLTNSMAFLPLLHWLSLCLFQLNCNVILLTEHWARLIHIVTVIDTPHRQQKGGGGGEGGALTTRQNQEHHPQTSIRFKVSKFGVFDHQTYKTNGSQLHNCAWMHVNQKMLI